MNPEVDFAHAYAAKLLRDAGVPAAPLPVANEHPALAWHRSLLMDVTGHAHGPGLMCPLPIAAAADGALIAFATLAQAPSLADMRGATLLGQRARLMDLRRNGGTAPGGACRLLQTVDGWLALSLARPDDWACLPALTGDDTTRNWDRLAMCVRRMATAALLERAQLLGLAAARADLTPPIRPWYESAAHRIAYPPHRAAPVVLDLSTLWAGPLCGALLQRAGATVIKCESTDRPDGARQGHAGFYDFLNAGKSSVSLDLRAQDGVAGLRRLIRQADIVIESARPRALRQIGLQAETIIAEQPGLTWLSITGHGRTHSRGGWAGFGDDAGAAAGLCHAMQQAHGDMVFCGDAIADPLTGLHAAIAAWSSWQQGGGRLVSLSLSAVTAHCAAQGRARGLADRAREWTALVRRKPVAPLPLPQAPGRARPCGADTNAVMSAVRARC